MSATRYLPSRSLSLVPLLLLAALWSVEPRAAVWAQDAADAADDASDDDATADAADAKEADEADPDALREQTIYIPYDKLRETFEKEGRGVFLPYEKFRALWEAAQARELPAPPDRPPVGAVITAMQSEATLGESVMQVDAELKIDLVTGGWHKVPLRLADAAILSATIDDKPALVVGDAKQGYQLLVENQGDKPRQVVLQLVFARDFSKAPGRNRVSFQAPLAAVSRWRVRIPEAGVKVQIEPMLAATEVPGGEPDADAPEPAADETVVLAFVGAAPQVEIAWTPKAEGASGLAALASVQAEQEMRIEQGVVRTRCRLQYTISRAALDELAIDVPADEKVAGVFDPNVQKWEVEEVDGKQRVRVQLFEPARDRQEVTLELERFLTEGDQQEVPLATVEAVGAARQQGIVVVRLAGGLRAEPLRKSGLAQLDPSEVPEALRTGGWAFAWRYAALPMELALQVARLEPRIEVDQLVEASLEPQRFGLDLFANYTIERAGVFELAVQLPAGYELREVRGHKGAGAEAAAVDTHYVEGDETPILRVNLARKALGKVGLLVRMERRLDDPNLLAPTGTPSAFTLELPRVLDVARLQGRLVVYAAESLRVRPRRADGLRSVAVREALEGSVSNCRAKLAPLLAWLHHDEPPTLEFDAERRKPHVTARQLLVARIEAGVVKFNSTLFYDIRYSGVPSLRIDLPESIAPQVRNLTTTVRDKPLDPQPDDVAEGYVAWGLTGETELSGSVSVPLSWETPIDELQVGQRQTIDVPRIVPREIDRAWGQIVLTKAETIDVRPAEGLEGLRPIDPQHDLMPGASAADAARAFEFHDDWKLAVSATRYELEEVKTTSVEQAVVRMVATRSERVAVQALYRLRSARQRVEIVLPADVAPGEVEFDTQPLRINGIPVTLEHGADKRTFFVPLVGHDPQETLVVELRYTLPGGPRQLDLPEFPDEPAVQQVFVCVYLPEELALVGSRGPWSSEQRWRERGLLEQQLVSARTDAELIGRLCAGVDVAGDLVGSFPTDGRLYVFSTLRPAATPDAALRLSAINEKGLHGAVFGLIALVGAVLTWRPVSQRLWALAALVVGLVLLGVFLPTLSRQITGGPLAAGLLLVLLLWLVAWLARARPLARARETFHAVVAVRRERKAKKLAAAAASAAPPPAAGAAGEGGEHHG